MFNKLKLNVSTVWILLIALVYAANHSFSCVSLQFLSSTSINTDSIVNRDNRGTVGDYCTVFEQSCICDSSKMNLTSEQKQIINKLYKNGGKIERSKSHIDFIFKCINCKIIPTNFQLKNTLPGNRNIDQEKLDKISFESMVDEKQKHSNILIGANLEFEKNKELLRNVLNAEKAESELLNLKKHLEKVHGRNSRKKNRKFNNLCRKAQVIPSYDLTHCCSVSLSGEDTLVNDDDNHFEAHNQGDSLPSVPSDVTLVGDDENHFDAHNQGNSLPNVSDDVTTVFDDDNQMTAHRVKKKRRFKRKYLQPQPKRKRKRKHNDITMMNVEDTEALEGGWHGIVKNFSDQAVTDVEKKLFMKGKKFCPIELDPPIVRSQNELNSFYRTLRIQWLFQDQSDKRTNLEKNFYHKSNWEPPPACLEVENMISRIQEHFDRWKPPRHVKDNLTKAERDLLKQIRSDPNIVYMWEDKGASFTKMSKEQYVSLGERELESEVYMNVDQDPSLDLKSENDKLVNKMFRDNEISENVANFLLHGDKKLSNFYHLIKTHKIPPTSEPPVELPLRGIISARSSPLERLAGLVDYFLKPGMESLPTFLQDTKHVLLQVEELNEKIDRGEVSLEGVALVSLDIESMYTNMSLDLGKSACKDYLDSRFTNTDVQLEPDALKVTTKSILEALDLCVKNNFFLFNSKIYKQKDGVGTGIKLAPPFTCLGVGMFENDAFSSDHELLELVLWWKRYIDDVLMLFKGSEEQCQEFVNWLNSLMPGTIKFKFEYSLTQIEFLDLSLRIESGRIVTNLYVKPTNLQLFLDFHSNHPQHCKDGIVYSQAIRIIERCTKPEDMEANLSILKEKLLDRNFPINLIERKFQKAKAQDRRSILKRKPKSNADNKVRGIFTYNKGGPPIYQWIRDAKKQLVKNEKAKKLGEKIQIGWKQPKNLQRLVCGIKSDSRTPGVDNPGCWKCQKCTVGCPVLVEGKIFTSTNTKKSYTIRKSLNCQSKFVIYLATCQKCSGQYVGKATTQFKVRHSNHRQEIKNRVGGLGITMVEQRSAC